MIKTYDDLDGFIWLATCSECSHAMRQTQLFCEPIHLGMQCSRCLAPLCCEEVAEYIHDKKQREMIG